jgi:hypothetical protein
MSAPFKREERYVVFKLSDVQHLSYFQREMLELLQQEVSNIRDHLHKPELFCAVVESDWPEYEPVWKMIEERMK